MAKYEAIIDLTVEVDADSPEQADQVILNKLTDKVLELAGSTYKIWIDVRQIEAVAE